MKYLAMKIPEDLHAAAKEKAARDRTTLKGLVIQLLRQAVGEKGGKHGG